MPVRDGDHHRNHHVMAIFSKESQLDLRRQSAIPNSNGGGRSSGDEFQLHFTTSQGGRDLRCVDPEVEAGTFYLNWWLYHVLSSHMTHFLKQWCSWSTYLEPCRSCVEGRQIACNLSSFCLDKPPLPPTTSCQCPTLRDFELHQSICEHDADDPSLMLDQNQSPIFSGKSPDLRTVVFAW